MVTIILDGQPMAQMEKLEEEFRDMSHQDIKATKIIKATMINLQST